MQASPSINTPPVPGSFIVLPGARIPLPYTPIEPARYTPKEPARVVKTRFVARGYEMIEKPVKKCGRVGRIYLPQEWLGKRVKVIRLD